MVLAPQALLLAWCAFELWRRPDPKTRDLSLLLLPLLSYLGVAHPEWFPLAVAVGMALISLCAQPRRRELYGIQKTHLATCFALAAAIASALGFGQAVFISYCIVCPLVPLHLHMQDIAVRLPGRSGLCVLASLAIAGVMHAARLEQAWAPLWHLASFFYFAVIAIAQTNRIRFLTLILSALVAGLWLFASVDVELSLQVNSWILTFCAVALVDRAVSRGGSEILARREQPAWLAIPALILLWIVLPLTPDDVLVWGLVAGQFGKAGTILIGLSLLALIAAVVGYSGCMISCTQSVWPHRHEGRRLTTQSSKISSSEA